MKVADVVRLSSVYENPADALGDGSAAFWQNGVKIPTEMVPAEMLTPEKVAVLADDGTMHILLTPEVTGSTEAISNLRNEVQELDRLGVTSLGMAAGILPATLMDYVNSAPARIERFNSEKGSFWQLWGLLEDGAKNTLDTSMKLDFSPDNLASLSSYVSEVVTAIKNGSAVSAEDLENLKSIVTFLQGLEVTGVGENVTAGIGDALVAATWETDAESVAQNLENALNAALQIQSPSQRVKPIGENAAAGVGVGMAEYDLSTDAATMAQNLESAISAAITADALSLVGASAAAGLASAMITYNMVGTGATVATHVKSAVAGSLTGASLHSIGLNAMAGLRAGINAGRSGVVSAMRSAAKAAVSAAKSELKIKSPSVVFRDEVGRMAMKGLGLGALLESKTQAKVIRNASRFLTDEAKEEAIAYSSNDNRRTYNQQSSVLLSGNTFYVRDEQDIRSLAIEIASLTKRQQRGRGLRMA